MTCKQCHGRGRIELFTSTVLCDCVNPNKVWLDNFSPIRLTLTRQRRLQCEIKTKAELYRMLGQYGNFRLESAEFDPGSGRYLVWGSYHMIDGKAIDPPMAVMASAEWDITKLFGGLNAKGN